MSRGTNLQEMEVGSKQSKTAVNANAKAGDPMQSLSGSTPGQTGQWEDLGGPTPENYRSDDDSAKIKTPGASLKQVKDVVNKGAKPAEGVKEEEELDDEDFISEEEDTDADSEELEEDIEDSDEEDLEEDDEDDEELDIEEDVKALFGEEDLSEEFKDKARTIFEAAIASKIAIIEKNLTEQYEDALSEEVEEIKETLTERLDSYLEYVTNEWFEENALAIEQGLKNEMTESFLIGMKDLFEAHYVSIPEEKYDVLNSMVEKLDEMEEKLNEQIEKNIHLNKRLAESVADGIFDEISEGLAATQKEKLASLAESVEFECEEEYREKLETLREAYFPKNVASPSAKRENLSEGVDSSYASVSDSMNAYLSTLSKFSK
jgi:outer membrane protein OmpA-like peptidoglycan-associated protein